MNAIYKVIEDRQGDDYMLNKGGDYDFWLDWALTQTCDSNAERNVIEKQLVYLHSLNEKELIKFIDNTWELTIV